MTAKPLPPKLGIASTSFMGATLGKSTSPGNSSASAAQAKSTLSLPPVHGRDTLEFVEMCHALGAAGVQTQIVGDPHALRARIEESGMWIEAMISVRNSSPEQLEQSIVQAKEAGCTVARDGLLGGRRYETFDSLAGWNAWLAESMNKLSIALPLFEKHKFTLALENHKDWTLDDYLPLFQNYSSEYLGACLDFGNNISLLDNLMDTIEAAAPYVKATHLKDIDVAPCPEGFLLSEVPLGTGVLDLPKAVDLVRKANPDVRLTLEMITRDPLKVSCLTDHYWITFPERNGISLARTLRFVNQRQSNTPLPKPEELSPDEHAKIELDNIKACLAYAQERF